MEIKETLQKIIANYHNKPFKKLVERDCEVPTDLNKIITVIGPRRSGKTALLQQTAQKIQSKGVKINQILFLDFEDERLQLTVDQLDLILQVYQEMYPQIILENCYFFFDEIQNVIGWEKFVRRMYDSVSPHLFLSGSNSKLLSSEIATELRGRTLTIEILPLSFREYLRFKNINSSSFDSATTARVNAAFVDFMQNGGFPEIALLPESFHKNILQEYFNVMIFRDIMERYGFQNSSVLKYFLKRMYESVGKPFSVNKVFNDLKSQGYKVGKNMLYEYSNAASAIFLSLEVQKFCHSIVKQEGSEKKYYAIDTGLLNALTFDFKDDFGRIFENVVLLELRKKGLISYFYKEYRECDFVVQKDDGTLLPIQVCYDMSKSETRKSEYQGLVDACEYLKVKKGLILTRQNEENTVYKDVEIEIKSAIRYFL